ncbi:heterokaryon incompatibility protein-domain-containing protein [Chaetomidium leptoderma]|uniref:Heterokaryon incompatibility protein-domain-containing protein n=1 Tax=Chaetomidium leptoderma TaxID=669021 RepID=A0AAN6VIR3_9PEZI|nr:heterokaryon incompatibility protein-domain-containing protein [Chaetomidium leptoderma]
MTSQTLYANLSLPPFRGTDDASIRLLALDADRSWRLNNTPLATCPTYKALSYHWGDANDTLPISCNGVEIQVTRNLHTALDQLKSTFPNGVTIWIDALCINQRDKVEQAQQVAIMHDIYSRAQEVLIWLEPSLLPENIDKCFAACRLYALRWTLAGHRIKSRGGVTDDSPDVAWDMLQAMAIRVALRNGDKEIFTPGIMDGLLKVFRQPYWSRVWIIQELCLAKKARILADGHWLSWTDFKHFLLMLEHCMNIFHHYGGQGGPSLAQLLVQFRWSQASNPRDKVYSLLGLVPPQDRALVGGDPDDLYKISTTECYTRVMFALLRQTRDLTLLVHCLAPAFLTRQRDLPSWVPDWGYDASKLPPSRFGLTSGVPYHRLGDTRPEIYRGYRASGGSECPAPILRDGPSGPTLVLHGMTAGRIATASRALEIHHQYARLEHSKGIPEPRPPGSWNEFSGEASGRFLRSPLFYPSLGRYLMWPVNAYRKGTALSIFLQWARLAESHGTWLEPPGPQGERDDELTAMFITLMNGRRGCDFYVHPLTDRPPSDLIAEMVREFRALRNALRWNPLLRLTGFLGIDRHLPSVYWFILGSSYDHHKGALHIFPSLVAAMQLFLALGLSYAYFTVPEWLRPFSLFWMALATYGNWNVFVPAKPRWLDAVLITPLDYALARLDDGRLALVPHSALPGNEIALLKGSPCPFVVQRVEKGWKLVGDCYVYGMMEGEMWREEEGEEMDIL